MVGDYIKECWRWATARADQAEQAVMVVKAVIAVVLFGVGLEWADRVDGLANSLLGFFPLGLYLILVAPYFIWKAEREKVDRLEAKLNPVLRLLAVERYTPDGTDYIFGLEVVNLGAERVQRCMAELVDVCSVDRRTKRANRLFRVKRGKLCWSRADSPHGETQITLDRVGFLKIGRVLSEMGFEIDFPGGKNWGRLNSTENWVRYVFTIAVSGDNAPRHQEKFILTLRGDDYTLLKVGKSEIRTYVNSSWEWRGEGEPDILGG